MSVAAVAWALEQPVDPPTRKLILVVLAERANSEGKCWPPLEQVAESARVTVRAASRHIHALAADGYLLINNQGRNGNCYDLAVNRTPVSAISHVSRTLVSDLPDPECPINENESRTSMVAAEPEKVGHTGSFNRKPVSDLQPPLSPPSDVSPNNPFLTPPLTPQNKDPASDDAEDQREGEHEKVPKKPAWLKRLSLDAWQELTPVHIAQLETQANRLGVDIADESMACDDWMKHNGRNIKAPYATLKNWLDKAASKKGFNGDKQREQPRFGRITPPKPGELSITRRHIG